MLSDDGVGEERCQGESEEEVDQEWAMIWC